MLIDLHITSNEACIGNITGLKKRGESKVLNLGLVAGNPAHSALSHNSQTKACFLILLLLQGRYLTSNFTDYPDHVLSEPRLVLTSNTSPSEEDP